MNCKEVHQLIEEYIMGEVDTDKSLKIKKHLDECENCKKEYEETKELIGGLKEIKNSIIIKKDILSKNERSIVKSAQRKGSSIKRVFSSVAAAVFFIMFLLSSSIIAFPTFASNYVPELPVVRQLRNVQNDFNAAKQEIEEITQQNKEIMQQNVEIRMENEELKRTIKTIGETSIVEYQTSKGIDPRDNYMIQEMVISFIRAQYRGDLETIKEMCTDEFKLELDRRKDEIIYQNKGDVIFTQITNVAKEGEVYMVFVRLNDTSDDDAADYQLNFELQKVNGRFLVSFVGKDA
ncbi:UNVERIFIED_CONTAM: putative zinc finger protein [Acetivibrio alkalicellulosi]